MQVNGSGFHQEDFIDLFRNKPRFAVKNKDMISVAALHAVCCLSTV